MQISIEDMNGVTVCRVDGDVDINSSPDMKKYFEKVIKEKKEKVVIDLVKVNYVDSSGLATFVEVLKKMRAYKGELRLANLSDKVLGLFEITRLDKLFKIVKSEEEAVNSF